jgi:hypothetical protein
MNEWYAVRNSTTFDEFLDRNKEVKQISYKTDKFGLNRRLWVEDIFGNTVFIITDVSEGLILEVRCYAPNDPSFILFLIIREGSQIFPEESPNFYVRNPWIINKKDFERATLKFLTQIRKDKIYKIWCSKKNDFYSL